MIDPLDKVSESDLSGWLCVPGAAAGPAARAWLPAGGGGPQPRQPGRRRRRREGKNITDGNS